MGSEEMGRGGSTHARICEGRQAIGVSSLAQISRSSLALLIFRCKYNRSARLSFSGLKRTGTEAL